MFGADGSEMDHYLGNLSSALYYRKKLDIVFIDACSYSFILNKNMTLCNIENHMISIIPLFLLDEVTLQGCQYRLNREMLKFGSRIGILTRTTANEVKISYTKGEGIIFISHDKYFP